VLRELLGACGAELIEFHGAGTPDGVSGNTAAHWDCWLEAPLAPLRCCWPLVNHGGSTTLQSVVPNGQAEAVRLLRRHGADAEAPDEFEFGDSALDLAQVTFCGSPAAQ
jgi:hypothetical protein